MIVISDGGAADDRGVIAELAAKAAPRTTTAATRRSGMSDT
jgi:hypothetical protein